MTSIAQDLGGVVRLLEKATPVVWEVCDRGSGDADLWFSPYEAWCDYDGRLMRGTLKISDAEAIVAAVNFLRTHSAEIAGALRDAEKWQPIESAPRDGERIILGRPDLDGDGGGISVAGYWLEELEDGVDYMGHDGGFTDVDFQVFQPGRSFGSESYRYAGSQPTHWRQLPAPPTQDSAMQQGGGGGE